MGRPSMPIDVLKETGKKHLTKTEIKAREDAEKALLSGMPLYESPSVKHNKAAHKEFKRVSSLLEAIGKADALYSTSINTRCMLLAEVLDLLNELQIYNDLIEKMNERINKAYSEQDDKALQGFTEQLEELSRQKMAIYTTIDRKRRMMFEIDKENVMTVSSSLRAIPKKPVEEISPLQAALQAIGDDEE